MDEAEHACARQAFRPRRAPFRQLVRTAILLLILLLVFRVVGAEPYQVPTGSMWPALAGNHRAMDCPRCGYRVVVGRHRSDHGQAADGDRCYRAAFCPNCGCPHLDIARIPECPGDHVLVNKSVFDFRRPRRWEMIVFRSPAEPGKAFVKRVVGLPGEQLRIRDGDVTIDGVLVRKSLAEFKAVRIPVFDNNFQPRPHGFRDRWESWPARAGSSPLCGTTLRLQGEGRPEQYQCLRYHHYLLDEQQSQPLQDEYVYNCGEPRALVNVHDLMLDCDLRVEPGRGSVRFGITDGADWLVVEIPVGQAIAASSGEMALLRQTGKDFEDGRTADAELTPACRQGALRLEAGRTYHVELAFVDRRLTLAVDGRLPFAPLDLPPAGRRAGLVRPVEMGVRGVNAVVSNFRLHRDIHYTQAGTNGIGGVVTLGPGEYFVLGDNSPNSDDSRFWPNRGVVPERLLIGKPFLAHYPSRMVRWGFLGQERQHVAPDWSRIRWLK